jgi:DNA modification methylase
VDCIVTSPPYYRQRTYGSSSTELGKESSVAEYIANLVSVFKAVPLESWGSLWVNIGNKRGKYGELLQIPQQFCLAMRNARFYLIDEVIWAKESVKVNGESIGHSMIEPAARRLNGNGHEAFYRFVLDPKTAWSDTSAVRIPRLNVLDIRYLPQDLMSCHTSTEGRNLGNVWNVSPGKSTESHYAVFPTALLERPVAMTCPLEITGEGPKCRKIVMVPYEEARPTTRGIGKYTKPEEEIHSRSGRQDIGRSYIPRKPTTLGWYPDLPTLRRGVVLDPFCGSGSAGEVALKLGRNFIGIDLYENYAQIAEERCRRAQALRSAYEVRHGAESVAPFPAPSLPDASSQHGSVDLDSRTSEKQSYACGVTAS